MEGVEQILSKLDEVLARLDAMDAKICKFAFEKMTKAQENALRRQIYREKKEATLKCRLPMPERCVFEKDARLGVKFDGWAEVGMRFAVKGRGPEFVQWLVWEWNNSVYLKKPITFSGSSFKLWNGHARHGYGPVDLFHLYRKRKVYAKFLRNKAEHQDFSGRKFWNWGFNVLRHVYGRMKEREGWQMVPQRFKDTCCLLIGGPALMKIDNDYWDMNESLETINRMMPKVLHLWLPLLECIATGLRAKEQRKVP